MAAARPDREPHSAGHGVGARTRSAAHRVADAWRTLDSDQRLAAGCAIALFVTMLLPWYTKTEFVVSGTGAKVGSVSLNAFQAFSFVEAAVLLVAASVLVMLFSRAEGRAFHLPGGDGTIIMIAGGWAAILIFYRLLDKPGLQGAQRITASVGVTWGIFLALLVAIGLAVAGARVRAARRPEPTPLEPMPARAAGRDRSRRRLDADDELTGVSETAATDVARPANRGRRQAEPDQRAGRPADRDERPTRPAGSADAAEQATERPRYPPPPGAPSRGRMVTREDAAQLSFEDTSATEAFGDDLPPRRRPDDPPPRRRRRG